MIVLGIFLLLSAIGLIWFRTSLTGTRVGGDIPFSVYVVNESGETTLLWIAGLIGLLGIGLIVAGLVRPKRIAVLTDTQVDIASRTEPQDVPEPVYCSNCKADVMSDADHRCPSCGWST